jgi:hypothetical protein
MLLVPLLVLGLGYTVWAWTKSEPTVAALCRPTFPMICPPGFVEPSEQLGREPKPAPTLVPYDRT